MIRRAIEKEKKEWTRNQKITIAQFKLEVKMQRKWLVKWA
jgi:hypothetical protein